MKTKLLFIALGVLSATILFIIAINFFSFRVTSVSPRNKAKNVPTFSEITVGFNKNLSKNQPSDFFSITPKPIGNTVIKNKTIVFTPTQALNEITYSVTVNAVSESGSKVSKKFSFSVKYTDFNKLDSTSQLKDIQQSNNPENTYKISKILPYDTEEYKIETVFADKPTGVQEKDFSIKITVFAILNRPDQYSDFVAQAKEYKANALLFLKNAGIDYTKYSIDYYPKDSTGKFVGDN